MKVGMNKRAALRLVFGRRIVRRSLIVALVVGTVLNAINQGSEVWDGHPVIWRLILTYCVPFLVSSYGAYSAIRTQDES